MAVRSLGGQRRRTSKWNGRNSLVCGGSTSEGESNVPMIPLTSTHSSTLSIMFVSPIGRRAFGNPFSVKGSSLGRFQPQVSIKLPMIENARLATHDMPYPHKITAWKSGTSVLLVTRVVLNRPVVRALVVVPNILANADWWRSREARVQLRPRCEKRQRMLRTLTRNNAW